MGAFDLSGKVFKAIDATTVHYQALQKYVMFNGYKVKAFSNLRPILASLVFMFVQKLISKSIFFLRQIKP